MALCGSVLLFALCVPRWLRFADNVELFGLVRLAVGSAWICLAVYCNSVWIDVFGSVCSAGLISALRFTVYVVSALPGSGYVGSGRFCVVVCGCSVNDCAVQLSSVGFEFCSKLCVVFGMISSSLAL